MINILLGNLLDNFENAELETLEVNKFTKRINFCKTQNLSIKKLYLCQRKS